MQLSVASIYKRTPNEKNQGCTHGTKGAQTKSCLHTRNQNCRITPRLHTRNKRRTDGTKVAHTKQKGPRLHTRNKRDTNSTKVAHMETKMAETKPCLHTRNPNCRMTRYENNWGISSATKLDCIRDDLHLNISH